MFKDKKQALRCARHAAIAREIAQLKSRRQFKRTASGKKPYKPGTIVVSEVSAAIKKEYGSIRSRWQRKYYAKAMRKPFVAFTAGR